MNFHALISFLTATSSRAAYRANVANPASLQVWVAAIGANNRRTHGTSRAANVTAAYFNIVQDKRGRVFGLLHNFVVGKLCIMFKSHYFGFALCVGGHVKQVSISAARAMRPYDAMP